MRRIALLLAVASSIALSGCGVTSALTGIPASPAAVTSQTKLDEQVGLLVTLSYTAAARAAALAIRLKLPFADEPSEVVRIGQLNKRAYAAVLAVHDAYKAANASGYLSALTQARAAISDLLAAAKGN